MTGPERWLVAPVHAEVIRAVVEAMGAAGRVEVEATVSVPQNQVLVLPLCPATRKPPALCACDSCFKPIKFLMEGP